MSWLNTVGNEARIKLLEGFAQLAYSVGASMGPAGRNTLIDHTPCQPSCPLSSRDGVTIARSMYNSDDPVVDAGIRLCRAASEKTVEVAGDGTSATVVLAHGFLHEGLQQLAKGTIRDILTTITKDTVVASHMLSKMVVPVSGKMIDQVSCIAVNNDPILGTIIADAIRSAGPHGVVSVEDGGNETVCERQEGMFFSSGWRSQGFVNRLENQSVEFDNPVIFMLDRKLTSLQGLTPCLAGIEKSGRPLLILAENTDGEALAQLLILKSKGVFQVCCVNLPDNLGSRADLLKDISALVGGRPILKELQQNAADVSPADLGQCRRVIVTKNSTRIIGGSENPEAVKRRTDEIRGLLASNPPQVEMERLSERMAKLTGGVTVLKLGSQTQLEGADIKLRTDDAICSIHCAIDGGVVPGGGTALLRVAQHCEFKSVLEAPFRKILENAGYDPEPIRAAILGNPDMWYGFNVLTGQYCDLMDAGILDPLKVVTQALLNAASVARQTLLTNTVISLVRE